MSARTLPPRNTAVGVLSAAVARLEAHPMDASLEGPTQGMLEALAPQLPLWRRMMMRNLCIAQHAPACAKNKAFVPFNQGRKGQLIAAGDEREVEALLD